MKFKTGFKIKDGVTQSMLGKWTCCRERTRYSLDGWHKPGDSAAIEFGSFFHLCREKAHYQPKRKAESIHDDSERSYLEQKGKEGGDISMVQEQINRCFPIFKGWRYRYGDKDAKKKWIQIEGLFDVLWKGYRLRGKRDGVFQHGSKYWLYELKTKGEISEDIINQTLLFDFQTYFYATAWQAEKGVPLSGVLYDVVRNPRKADGLEEDITKRPDHYYKRFEVPINKARLKRFAEELEGKLHDFNAWLSGKIPHYRNESHCIGRGYCDFIGPCATGCMDGFRNDGILFGELQDA